MTDLKSTNMFDSVVKNKENYTCNEIRELFTHVRNVIREKYNANESSRKELLQAYVIFVYGLFVKKVDDGPIADELLDDLFYYFNCKMHWEYKNDEKSYTEMTLDMIEALKKGHENKIITQDQMENMFINMVQTSREYVKSDQLVDAIRRKIAPYKVHKVHEYGFKPDNEIELTTNYFMMEYATQEQTDHEMDCYIHTVFQYRKSDLKIEEEKLSQVFTDRIRKEIYTVIISHARCYSGHTLYWLPDTLKHIQEIEKQKRISKEQAQSILDEILCLYDQERRLISGIQNQMKYIESYASQEQIDKISTFKFN